MSAEGDCLEVLEGDLPPAGTSVVLSRHRDGWLAETLGERATRLEQEERAQAQRDRLEKERRGLALQKAQRNAEEANARLRIPVRWTSGRKTVLSGLSRISSGTGDNARSVVHVLLLEPVNEGGFRRAEGSFLCTPRSGSQGKAWTGVLHTRSNGAIGPYVGRITCKQCLTRARRWAASAAAVLPELVPEIL